MNDYDDAYNLSEYFLKLEFILAYNVFVLKNNKINVSIIIRLELVIY